MYEDNTYEFIGRATVAWSDVELTWYLIYLTVSHSDRDEADAVYFTPNNSATERKITCAIAEVSLIAHPDLMANLNKLDTQTGRLAGDRNAIAHGKFIFAHGMAETNKSVDLWSVGKNRLIGKPLNSELLRMETDFLQLANDLSDFMYLTCVALGKEPPSIEK